MDLSYNYKFPELDLFFSIISKLPDLEKFNYTNGSENVRINESQISYYESLGYWRGVIQFNGHRNHNPNSGCKGFRCMNNGIESKYVNPNDIPTYQSQGWVFGRIKS